MSVTLAMNGNYPDIYSGSITFLNTRTGDKVSLTMPKDVESGVYEIRNEKGIRISPPVYNYATITFLFSFITFCSCQKRKCFKCPSTWAK